MRPAPNIPIWRQLSRARPSAALERLGNALRGDPPEDADWVDLVATANDHFVGPHLFQAVRDAKTVDPEARDYLAALAAANGERNARLIEQLGRIAAAMNARKVTPIILKGAALLARERAPETLPRMISDIDVLVTPDCLVRSHDALSQAGYAVLEGSERGHSAGTYWRSDETAAIDLHHALPKGFRSSVTGLDLVARTKRILLAGGRIRVPDPTLHLAINVAHDMLHDAALYSGATELRPLLELIELTARPDMDYDWLDARRANFPFALALELQSRMGEHLLGRDPFPHFPRTQWGAFLHQRRLFKLRHDLTGRLEWALLRRWPRWRTHTPRPERLA